MNKIDNQQRYLFIVAMIIISCFFFNNQSHSNPINQDRENVRISVLVLLGEWFGDAYFPLKNEIDARGWSMKKIGVDVEYRGCYNKARDVVLRSDILIPDLEDFFGLDCLIIPSGPQWRKFNQNPRVLQFVRDAYDAGLLIASFCVGNRIVWAAGLIDSSLGPNLLPDEVTLVKDRILMGPRGGGPPPGDGFESAPVKEICDAIVRELKIDNVPSQSNESRTIQVNEDLTVEIIEENVIIATHRFPWAGNCLAVRVAPSQLVLIDTPWETTGTKALLQWLRDRFGRVQITAVNTHFHQDNLGGNVVLLSRHIPIYGSDLTVRLLEENKSILIQRTLKNLSDPKYKRYFDAYQNLELQPPDHIFELEKDLTLHIGEEAIELFYPGPAHTQDNIVVYFPKRKILFGGCMIRSMASTRIGIHSDGDMDSWPQSAKNVLDRFPEARIVIPGHGTWGDIRIVQHTIDLVSRK